MEIGAVTMEVTQKIKNRAALWYGNSTFGYLSEQNKNTNSKRYMPIDVNRSIIYNSQDTKTNG